jgi:hypothetical protein
MFWGTALQIYSIGIAGILGIVLVVMFALTLVRRWHALQEHHAFMRWLKQSQYYIINAPRGSHSRRVRLDAQPDHWEFDTPKRRPAPTLMIVPDGGPTRREAQVRRIINHLKKPHTIQPPPNQLAG